MESTSHDATGLPLTGGLALVAAVLIALFAVKLPSLEGSRPPVASPIKQYAGGTEEVSARLWQDPFLAVEEHIGLPEADVQRTLTSNPVSRLKTEIAEDPKSSMSVKLLGVMTFGGPYAENAERRLRSRYAVVSALGTSGYTPDDPGHVGFVTHCLLPPGSSSAENTEHESTSNPETHRDSQAQLASAQQSYVSSDDSGQAPARATCPKEGIPILIPYEWFRKEDTHESVLVLWLNDDVMQRHPLNYLDQLFAELVGDKAVEKTVIGPAGSTNLRYMLKQLTDPLPQSGKESKSDTFKWPALKDARILSSSATADRYYDCTDPTYTNIRRLFEQQNIKFRRTIATDRTVLEALINELKLRGIKPTTDHMAIVSEWDTEYGRSLPQAFCTAVYLPKEGAPIENNSCKFKNIERYSYLRGLDGKISGEKSTGDDEKPNRHRPSSSNSVDEVERPVGRAQTDYLRRLGETLTDRNAALRREGEQRGIRAIGVLGSDVYDKMMVLKALRDRFPGALFFTTDMDASFLHPKDYRWTRNLIVATGYGLELQRVFQQTIPPFRDVYESSLYFSTLLATRTTLPKQSEIDCLVKPKIIEIARFEPYVFNTSDLHDECNSETLGKIVDNWGEYSEKTEVDSKSNEGDFNYEYSTFVRRSSYIIGFTLLFLYLGVRFYGSLPPRLDELDFFKELLFASSATAVVVLGGAVPLKLELSAVTHFSIFSIALFLVVGLVYAVNRYRVTTAKQERRFWPAITGVLRNFVLPSLAAGLIGITLPVVSNKLEGYFLAQVIIVLLLSILILVYLLYRAASSEFPKDRGGWRNIWLLAFGGSLFAGLSTLIAAQSKDGEPIAFLSGISIWPGEFLRIAGGLLGLYFIVHAVRRIAENRELIDGTLCPGPGRRCLVGDKAARWWGKYTFNECASERIGRAALLAFVYYVITGSIVQITPPMVPFRGDIAYWVDKYVILGFSVPLLLVLTMFVLDATKHFSTFVEQLRDYLASKSLKSSSDNTWLNPDKIWEIIRLIAVRSDALAPLVVYPVVVILVMALSRSSYFDKWDFPLPLYIVIGLTSLYPIYSAIGVRRSAERARQAALFALQQQLRTVYHAEQTTPKEEPSKPAGKENTTEVSGKSAKNLTSEEIRMVIQRVENIRQGAFRPYSQQPWLQSLILFFGGSGSLILLEYFILAR